MSVQVIPVFRSQAPLVLTLMLLLCGLPALTSAQAVAGSQSAEERELRALVQRFFAPYQKQDLQDSGLLWNDKSPSLPA